MKIRWEKRSPGIYESDSGRFVIRKDGAWYGRLEEWIVYDLNSLLSDVPVANCKSLKLAKRFVDDLLTEEEKTDV